MDNTDQSGSKNVALVRFIDDNVEYSCPLSRIRNRNCLRPGDKRNVKWVDNVFYPARIEKITNDGQVDVTFMQDKVKYRTKVPYIAEANDLKIGDNRLVKWTNGKYYEAIILELGNQVPNNSVSPDHEMNTNSDQCSVMLDKGKTESIRKAVQFNETMTSNINPSRDQHRQEPLDAEDPPRKIKKANIKKNWCMYCCEMQSKIGRHMAAKHKTILEVQQYIEAENSKIKKEIIQTIINKSNSQYNKMVMDKAIDGTVIPVKKSTSEITAISHVICTSCGGLFSKINISSHKTTCKTRHELIFKNQTFETPKFTLAYPTLHPKFNILRKRVLNFLSKDEISVTVIKDPLILEFGRRFLKGHMNDKQRNYVSSKVRTLGDLVCRMKKSNPGKINSLSDCLKVYNFDILCDVVKKWSAYDDESGICAVGSVPRRLCKALKVCSQVEWSESIKNSSIATEDYQAIRENHEKFMSLMNNDWALEVNCPGDKSLKKKKVEKEDKMPLAEDIVTFFNEMSKKMEHSTKKLKKQVSLGNYNDLCKTIISYLIAFNCRRPSEVAYATLENYDRRNMSSDETNKLVVFTVSATKNDIKVPVIVPDMVQEAIAILLNNRNKVNIVGNLLFGKQDGTPYNGSNVLMQAKQQIILKKPEHFTANGLRHYWATVSQMDQKLKAHMPKFLGHTLATHQKFYEMPMSDINLDVIGPSMIQHYNIGDANQSSEDSEPEERIVRPRQTRAFGTISRRTQADQTTPRTLAIADTSCSVADHHLNTTNCLATPRKRKHDSSKDSSGSEESVSTPLKMQKRNKWTTPEKLELLTKMPKTLLGIEPAGRGKISEVWENSKVIKQRHSLQMTRIEVSKYYTKKKKVSTPLKKQINMLK